MYIKVHVVRKKVQGTLVATYLLNVSSRESFVPYDDKRVYFATF